MPARFRLPPYEFRIETNVHCRFPAYLRRELAAAARATLRGLPKALLKEKLRPGVPYALSISVVGPKAIHELNRAYRGKNRPTDVLSFSRLEGVPTPLADIGDVILCWEVAKRQTKEFYTTRPGEVRRLVVHGVLHLFGYDHEQSASEEKRMFRLQESIVRNIR
jgi:probable rRNA maturation factor